uniref:Intermembrane lipid transfer protein VPS13-like C-terminal domain-containing protein n=1 Tax=Arcella intermedia TaxID=1963864 RepID=A0A6B2L199_9EUKA
MDFIQCVNWKKRFIKLTIKDCQIDNQLPNAPYPVLLYSQVKDHPEFLKFSLVVSEEQRDIYHIHYFSILMQELEFCADEFLAIQLLRFIDLTMESLEKEEQKTLSSLQSKLLSYKPQMLYASFMHFNPMRVRLSFRANRKGEKYKEEGIQKYDMASSLLAVPKRLVPNVDRAPINFNALCFEHVLTSTSDITQRLARTYIIQLNSQIYSLLGSAEVLGSPISFVTNLSDGVKDFFYEPAKGITLSPEEFVKGVGKGSLSLLRNSIFGLFGSAAKITGSIGSGVAMLSFDEGYQEKRLQKKHTQASNVIDGVAEGVTDLAFGLFSGITGIVVEPIKGAVEEGGIGFVKGVGKGLINVVVKPTVGVLDFASRTTEGIKNTPDAIFLDKVKPKRFSRNFPLDNRLKCFDKNKAEGKFKLANQAIFKNYPGDRYLNHYVTMDPPGYCFVTEKRVLVTNNDYSALKWELPYNRFSDMVKLQLVNQENPANHAAVLFFLSLEENGKRKAITLKATLETSLARKLERKVNLSYMQWQLSQS